MQIKNEVLRYLGYRGQTIEAKLHDLIDACIVEVEALAEARHVFREFDLYFSDQVCIASYGIILSGEAVRQHLQYSKKCIVMAVTIGKIIDQKINYYQYKDMAHATILDACATAYIEAVCDSLTKEFEEHYQQKGWQLTRRYSPGYGDFPLSMQPTILTLLNASKHISLTVNDHNLLIPRKSVTAIIGIEDKEHTDKQQKCKCQQCDDINCAYRVSPRLLEGHNDNR